VQLLTQPSGFCLAGCSQPLFAADKQGPNLHHLAAPDAVFCNAMQDAVSRVSLHNVAAVLDEILVALARCKQPTCRVRQPPVFHAVFCPSPHKLHADKSLCAPKTRAAHHISGRV
jgi:hypothetical protein